MDRSVAFICALYGCLQLAFCGSSQDLAVKLYTTQSLQHYSVMTLRSRIRCSARCIADKEKQQCAAFRFINNQCYLFNTTSQPNLSEQFSSDAQEIFVFEEKSIAYKDCQAAFEQGETTPGVYTLSPTGSDTFNAWCDFDGSSGWTVIQRRIDGSVDFERDWADYKAGFGDLDGNVWLGNDNIHALTDSNTKLSIFLDIGGNEVTANYSTFYISDEGDNYRLTVSGFTGDTFNAMIRSDDYGANGQQFTTYDRNNDNQWSYNCAARFRGAWWHNACFKSHLNGIWTDGTADTYSINWLGDDWNFVVIPTTIMRITRE